MDKILEELQKLGCNVEEGRRRLMQNDALYIRLLHHFPQVVEKCTLCENLEQQDYKSAFQAAHDMKGVTANLSLTPLYEGYSDMVSRLRAEKYDGLMEEGARLGALAEEICKTIQSS